MATDRLTYDLLTLTVSQFKRLRRGVRLSMQFGIPLDVFVEHALNKMVYDRQHADRVRIERRA
jgi:hypothetical protein